MGDNNDNLAAQQRAHALEAAIRTPNCQHYSDVLSAAKEYLQFLQQGPQLTP